ncbi:Alpha/Beta hydrolase protein [Gorgonomyces haynaldii]|nr:Alpha/Beta hydrolase protein [Gorgonomyces haynaldii]
MEKTPSEVTLVQPLIEQPSAQTLRTLKDIQNMSSPELIEYWGYPCEEHVFETKDGYLLGLQRIPNPKHGQTAWTAQRPYYRPAVLLLHALSTSSNIFLCLPEQQRNLALVLADNGFDVWLGNNRGNRYSKKHTQKSPNKEPFWDFAIDELAQYDVPCMIENILDVTGRESLSVIGLSQGTTQMFAALSLNEDLNHRVNCMIALAPALKPKLIDTPILKNLLHYGGADVLFKIVGKGEFFWIADLARRGNGAINYFFVHRAFENLLLWPMDQVGCYETKKVAYKHVYSHSSAHNFVHWFQLMLGNKFVPYQRPSSILDRLWTNPSQVSHQPTTYPTKHITTPLFLLHGGRDSVSDEAFMTKVLPPQTRFIKIEEYGHLDFIWSVTAPEQVYSKVLSILKTQ